MDYSSLQTEPVLQIVHLSDMHLIHPEFQRSNETRVLRRLLHRFEKLKDVLPDRFVPHWDAVLEQASSLRTVVESGFLGHDEDSIEELLIWLRERVRKDETWSQTPTWLIDTGDQSTNGDDASLNYGLSTIARFSSALGGAQFLRIHGNHDAWPGKHPLISTTQSLDEHKKKLRSEHFVADYPCRAQLSHTIPGTTSTIDAYSLNSVVHTWLQNGIARGEIKEDKYWEHRDSAREGMQVQALEHLAESQSRSIGSRSMRLILAHHPINLPYPHFLSSLGTRIIGLNGAEELSRELNRPRPNLDEQSLAHLILSGHTHELYPHIGGCADTVISRDEDYLHQLVIGTATKLNSKSSQGMQNPNPDATSITEFDNVYTNQIQILRISKPTIDSEYTQHLLAIDRIVAGRVMNTGPWRICTGGLDSASIPERFWIKY